ncbi:MAG: right-handed parallel beta-helix repeat-containing protein, partial [Actinobacteria bacterium]|nr:right-handed parallel beta-helix repeat-containing protein [Actinomycetota bacterium]
MFGRPLSRVAPLAAGILLGLAGSTAWAQTSHRADGNLVVNGSFASGLAGWSGYQATLSLVPGFDATPAVQVTAQSASFALSAAQRQVAKTATGTSYTAGAEVRGAAGKTLCGQIREWSGQRLVGSATQCVSGDGAWLPLAPITYTVAANGDSLDFYLYEEGGAKGDVFSADALSLTTGSASPPAPTPAPPSSGLGTGLPAPLPASNGPTYYVSTSGSDGASGSAGTPWRTIGHALASVQPGDTVLVHGGTYPDWLVASRGGTSNGMVTVAAYPGEQVTITGRLKVAADWLRFSGLDFVGQQGNSSDVLVWVDGSHDELANDSFTKSWMSAIYVGEGGSGGSVPTDVRIVGNDIESNGTHYNLDHGIYCGDCANVLIADNLIASNEAAGIQLYPDANHTIVTGNTIVRSGRFGIIVGSDGSTTSGGNLIVDNVVAYNAETGIRT